MGNFYINISSEELSALYKVDNATFRAYCYFKRNISFKTGIGEINHSFRELARLVSSGVKGQGRKSEKISRTKLLTIIRDLTEEGLLSYEADNHQFCLPKHDTGGLSNNKKNEVLPLPKNGNKKSVKDIEVPVKKVIPKNGEVISQAEQEVLSPKSIVEVNICGEEVDNCFEVAQEEVPHSTPLIHYCEALEVNTLENSMQKVHSNNSQKAHKTELTDWFKRTLSLSGLEFVKHKEAQMYYEQWEKDFQQKKLDKNEFVRLVEDFSSTKPKRFDVAGLNNYIKNPKPNKTSFTKMAF